MPPPDSPACWPLLTSLLMPQLPWCLSNWCSSGSMIQRWSSPRQRPPSTVVHHSLYHKYDYSIFWWSLPAWLNPTSELRSSLPHAMPNLAGGSSWSPSTTATWETGIRPYWGSHPVIATSWQTARRPLLWSFLHHLLTYIYAFPVGYAGFLNLSPRWPSMVDCGTPRAPRLPLSLSLTGPCCLARLVPLFCPPCSPSAAFSGPLLGQSAADVRNLQHGRCRGPLVLLPCSVCLSVKIVSRVFLSGKRCQHRRWQQNDLNNLIFSAWHPFRN
jgi:hypothetical protein